MFCVSTLLCLSLIFIMICVPRYMGIKGVPCCGLYFQALKKFVRFLGSVFMVLETSLIYLEAGMFYALSWSCQGACTLVFSGWILGL